MIIWEISIFSCAYWPFIYLWRKVYFQSSAHCWITFFVCVWLMSLYVFCLLIPYQVYDLQIFSPILQVVFLLCRWCLLMQKIFWFSWNPVSLFFFCYLNLWCHIQEIITKYNDLKLSPYILFWVFYCFRAFINTLIYF